MTYAGARHTQSAPHGTAMQKVLKTRETHSSCANMSTTLNAFMIFMHCVAVSGATHGLSGSLRLRGRTCQIASPWKMSMPSFFQVRTGWSSTCGQRRKWARRFFPQVFLFVLRDLRASGVPVPGVNVGSQNFRSRPGCRWVDAVGVRCPTELLFTSSQEKPCHTSSTVCRQALAVFRQAQRLVEELTNFIHGKCRGS